MSYSRFRTHSSNSDSNSCTPATASTGRFRLTQATPAPPAVDTNSASPVASDIPFTSARRDSIISILSSVLSIDSDEEDSIPSSTNPTRASSIQPEDTLDRSIPTRRMAFGVEEDFPVYSTVLTARFPTLPVVQANFVDYDTACR